MGGPEVGVAAVRLRPGFWSAPLTRTKPPVRKGTPRRATVGRFLWTGTLLGVAVGGGFGLAEHLAIQAAPADWAEDMLSFLYVLLGVAAGAAGGACLGALVGSLRLGGIPAATWVAGTAGALGAAAWLVSLLLWNRWDEDARFALLLLGAVSAPVVLGRVASWAVRREEEKRADRDGAATEL